MLDSVSRLLKRVGSDKIVVDASICAGLILFYGYVLADIDFFERLHSFTRRHETWELDEILCVLLIAPVFIALFAYRRTVELKEEIAAREHVETSMRELALTDPLTGLPNRRYLQQELRRRAAKCAREGGKLALLHLDLDRFKQINDTLGHAAGDFVLIRVANILRSATRQNEFVARVGGDEFVVVSETQDKSDGPDRLASRLLELMDEPVYYEGVSCRYGGSVGIAIADGGTAAGDLDRLLINSDIALHRSKEKGRGRYEYFSKALQQEFEHEKRITDEILSGIERREFFPVYQPQFDSKSLNVVGVEALARWNHPRDGVLAPSHFLSVAEKISVTADIDHLILEQALSDLRQWASAGVVMPNVAVNVSMQRLQNADFIGALSQLGVPAHSVTLELNESIFLDALSDEVRHNIEQLKALGIEIEIDDFGTGHTSIIALTRLKPARLKIDRELVSPVVSSEVQRNLVQSIVQMAKSLQIEVIAEGVETMDHARMLQQLGCDGLQGYGLARPMPAADVPAFVYGQSWRKTAGLGDNAVHEMQTKLHTQVSA